MAEKLKKTTEGTGVEQPAPRKAPHRFSSTNQPKNRGRKPGSKTLKALVREQNKNLSNDVKAALAKQMLKALMCENVEEAAEFCKNKSAKLGKGGIVLQTLSRDILKRGFPAIAEAYTILFGKNVDITTAGEQVGVLPPIAMVEFVKCKQQQQPTPSENSEE